MQGQRLLRTHTSRKKAAGSLFGIENVFGCVRSLGVRAGGKIAQEIRWHPVGACYHHPLVASPRNDRNGEIVHPRNRASDIRNVFENLLEGDIIKLQVKGLGKDVTCWGSRRVTEV